jgi:hypothetical protein
VVHQQEADGGRELPAKVVQGLLGGRAELAIAAKALLG